MPPTEPRHLLSDPARLKALTTAVRAKIPSYDIEDVVQSTLTDALTATTPPDDINAFDRWLFGIARHKIADYYRKNHRHENVDSEHVTWGASETTPESARDLLRWVNQELPQEAETNRTLEWMVREAAGDRLETIAREQQLSAPLVRQRVSRLRRYLRERWAMQLVGAMGLLVVITGLYAYRQRGKSSLVIRPEIVRVEAPPTPSERAEKLRKEAMAACSAGQWQSCLSTFERAKALDPVGDTSSIVQAARAGAVEALRPPAPAPAPVRSAKPKSLQKSLKKAPMQKTNQWSNIEPIQGN
jgi:DNA-directed RNA polymerase specialized sigma24 family protein